MIARIRHTALASLLLVLMTAACGNQAQQYFDEAEKFYASGQYQYAIDKLNEVIRVDPKHIKAYKVRGGAYYELGQYETAIQDLTEAILLEPQPALYCKRGRA